MKTALFTFLSLIAFQAYASEASQTFIEMPAIAKVGDIVKASSKHIINICNETYYGHYYYIHADLQIYGERIEDNSHLLVPGKSCKNVTKNLTLDAVFEMRGTHSAKATTMIDGTENSKATQEIDINQ